MEGGRDRDVSEVMRRCFGRLKVLVRTTAYLRRRLLHPNRRSEDFPQMTSADLIWEDVGGWESFLMCTWFMQVLRVAVCI